MLFYTEQLNCFSNHIDYDKWVADPRIMTFGVSLLDHNDQVIMLYPCHFPGILQVIEVLVCELASIHIYFRVSGNERSASQFSLKRQKSGSWLLSTSLPCPFLPKFLSHPLWCIFTRTLAIPRNPACSSHPPKYMRFPFPLNAFCSLHCLTKDCSSLKQDIAPWTDSVSRTLRACQRHNPQLCCRPAAQRD